MKALGLLLLGVIALAVGSIARDLRDYVAPGDSQGFKYPPGF